MNKNKSKWARRNVKNTKTRSTYLSNNTIYHQLQLSKVDKYNWHKYDDFINVLCEEDIFDENDIDIIQNSKNNDKSNDLER